MNVPVHYSFMDTGVAIMIRRIFTWFPLITLVTLAGLLAAVGPATAQDGGDCQPDFLVIDALLNYAKTAFAAGDTDTGLAALADVREQLLAIETACGGGVPPDVVPPDTVPPDGVPPDDGGPPAALVETLPGIDGQTITTWTEGSAYHVQNTGGERQFIPFGDLSVGDFTLTFDVTVQPGYVAGAEYGLAFRAAEGYYYHWRISTNGALIVYANTSAAPRGAMQGSQPKVNQNDWLPTPAYNTAAGATNRFKLSCQGDTCQYFINDEQVLQTTDKRLAVGGLELVTSGVVHVVFDNLALDAAGVVPPTGDGPATGESPPDAPPAEAAPADKDFNVSFSSFHPCGEWPRYVELRLLNVTGQDFESASVLVKAVGGGASLYGPTNNDRPFVAEGGCPPGDDTLPNNAFGFLAVNVSSADPGTVAEATVTLCTADDGGGDCVTDSVQFTVE
jgi:hypothetical protein